MIIDTHCHLDSKVYDFDLEQILSEARNLGLKGFISLELILMIYQKRLK